MGLSGSGAGARDGRAWQLSDRRPSPIATGGDGTSTAYLDRIRSRSNLIAIARTIGQAGRFDQDRRVVASVEPMEPHLQKKLCTPASKSARTCRRRATHGVKQPQAGTSKSWYFLMKPGHRPT